MNGKTFITKSPQQTMVLAGKIGKLAFKGLFIALYGELGCGKTLFVKGLAKGLGFDRYRYVKSPSFVIMRQYEASLDLYHFDAYRLEEDSFMQTVDYRRYFYSDGVTAVEWAGRIKGILPFDRLDIDMSRRGGVEERTITIIPRGDRPSKLLDEI